jgi:hypothetical protein
MLHTVLFFLVIFFQWKKSENIIKNENFLMNIMQQ